MLALLLELLDNTLKNSEDVEVRLKQPLLTIMPMLSKTDAERKVSGRIVLDSPNSLYAEAIRTARTGVLLSSVDMPSRTIVVTSSVPGEGKTTFSSNLAMAHALTKKTLLIDADMRRPSVSKCYGLDPNANGLSELVAGTAKLADCLHQIEGTNLMVMTSGIIPPNPLELLHSERFGHTLDALSKHFEIVIIDSPRSSSSATPPSSPPAPAVSSLSPGPSARRTPGPQVPGPSAPRPRPHHWRGAQRAGHRQGRKVLRRLLRLRQARLRQLQLHLRRHLWPQLRQDTRARQGVQAKPKPKAVPVIANVVPKAPAGSDTAPT
jgi:hypothetical protein